MSGTIIIPRNYTVLEARSGDCEKVGTEIVGLNGPSPRPIAFERLSLSCEGGPFLAIDLSTSL